MKLLRETDWEVDVVNVGMGNSGPDQQLRLFEKHVLPRLKPTIVIWAFYANDLFDNIRQPAFDIEDNALTPLDCSKHWLFTRQQFYTAFPGASYLREHSHLFQLLLKSFEYSEFAIDAETTAWSEKKIGLEIQRMERLAKQNDFQICYVLIAPQAVYLARAEPKTWNKHRTAHQYRLLQKVLRSAPNVVEILFKEGSGMIFATGERDGNQKGDRHFNELGYRLLAETLAAELTARRKTH